MISIHALREEGDSAWTKTNSMPCNFYPRPPRGGRLARFEFTCPACKFLSTPSARRATDGDISHYAVIEFLSTPSARRATSNNSFSIRFFLFLSTPSARRATHIVGLPSKNRVISIHALREEGDTTFRTPQQSASRFLSTPSARRATESIGDIVHIAQFLSTPSARRATLLTPRGADVDRYFYPRPPRGGRQLSTSDMAQGRRFLSTPSARRATVNSFNVYIDGVFLSTPSARRATTAAVGYDDDYEFLSTPSARRATLSSLNTGTGGADFYPRPPRGGRRISGKFRSNATGFLSTPSARRATQST